MVMICGLANANIHVNGKVATKVLLEYIPDFETRQKVVAVYNEELNKNNPKNTLSAESVSKICDAAGWDDAEQRSKFRHALVSRSDYTYYEVCKDDVKGKTGGEDKCIDDVFYHWHTVADTQVTMLQADGLCKEYARIKFNDDIECSNKSRPGTVNPNNDYVKCTSKLKPTYYEFKFDDVVESKDINITASVEKAVCEMHGVDYKEKSSSQKSTFSTNITFYPPKCKTSDANLCAKINESMKKFGYNTKIQNKECVISENTISSESQLRTAFGIDNLHFKTGYQLQSYANMRKQLCEYITKNANTNITSCECNYNRTQLNRGNGVVDDILTCYANNQPIDFLFDDLSEGSKTVRQGNMEAFACSVLGGEYQGKTCFTPDKKLCEQIAATTLSECPECAKAYFDTEKNACVLPNATKANEHQKNVNIGLIVSGAVVGAGIIIYTGGTGFAAVAVTLETIGAGMELGAQIHIDGVADEFFMKANNCNNATCAESILKEFFQYLSRMTNDLQSGELNGIESQMVRLIGLLPDDSQFLIDVVAGCYENKGDNFDVSKCDDGTWNNAQIIRAVGIGLQFTSVFASVGKWMLGAGRIQKIASKTPNLAKALSKKIPGVKARIAQKIAKGGKVTRSDGKVVNISNAAKGESKTVFKDAEYMGKLKGWKISNIETINSYPGMGVAVYKFKETNSGKTYFLKATNSANEEIKRTKRAYEILNNQSDIVHTVNVVEEDQTVLKDFAKKNNLPQFNGSQWFLMEETPATYHMSTDDFDYLLNVVLGGKPITITEKEEILQAIKRLNNGGIIHGDLRQNIFILREPNGKLRVDIIDYEKIPDRYVVKDTDFMNELFSKLSDNGCVEQKATSVAKTDDVAKGTSKTVFKDAGGTGGVVSRIENGTSFGRWKFDTVTDSTIGIKYYERVIGEDADVAQTIAYNIQNDFGKKALVFERDNKYVVAVFDNSNDLNAFQKSVAPKSVGIKNIISEDAVNDIVLHNHQVSERELEYVSRVYDSGPDGEKWVELWENYAPRNQSLEDFQKIYGNDLNKAESSLKNLGDDFYQVSASEADKRVSDLFDAYTAKHGFKKYKEYVDVRAQYKLSDHMTPKVKGLENWSQSEIDEAEHLYVAEQAKLGAKDMKESGALYSTYNPQITRINNKYKQQVGKINEEANKIAQTYTNQTGTANGYTETAEYKKLKQEYDNTIEQYQYEMGQIALPNRNINAAEMREKAYYIIDKYKDLQSRVDSWNTLSKNEKISLLQDIMFKYSEEYNTPNIMVIGTDIPVKDGVITNGFYDPDTKAITMNTIAGSRFDKSFKDVLSTFLHEYNHAIDDIVPNKGAVGNQIMRNSVGYTSQGLTYPLAQTEQASYAVSGAVKTSTNWPLVKAQNAQDAQRNLQNAAKAAASAAQSFQTTLKPW